jgi:hypothetical protein
VGGPALDRVIAKVTLLPAMTGFGKADCETDRSTGMVTTMVAALALLALLRSVSLTFALMVLVKVPSEVAVATTLIVAMPPLVTEPRLKIARLVEDVVNVP